jgi:hypothetical protein
MDDEREKRDGLIDRANDAYSAYRNARALMRLGRGIASAGRTIGALAATSEIWGPIAIAVGLVLFFTILIVVITGGGGQASEVTLERDDREFAGFTSTTINTKFYCQYDPRWTSSACNIAGVGCDPTALAMILASFGDTVWTPPSVAFANNMGCRSATTIPQIESSIEWTRSLGYRVSEQSLGFQRNFNLELAKKYIDNGYLLLGVANVTFPSGGQTRSGGHSFVITGVDVDNKALTVLDPTYCTSDSDYVKRRLGSQEVLCDSEGCGWYYVRAIKKI